MVIVLESVSFAIIIAISCCYSTTFKNIVNNDESLILDNYHIKQNSENFSQPLNEKGIRLYRYYMISIYIFRKFSYIFNNAIQYIFSDKTNA